MSRKRRSRDRAETRRTNLAEHQRQGKRLIPPLASIPNLANSSWRDSRLPEMLWAATLVTHLPQTKALGIFRSIAEYIHTHKEDKPPHSVTLSALAKLPSTTLQNILRLILLDQDCRDILRSLLLFNELPAREYWKNAISLDPEPDDWRILMFAVAKTLDHQSQESTDCRWLRVICKMAAGEIHFASKLEETAKGIMYYPDYGDLRKVRPSIRAMEIGLDREEIGDEWASKFWAQSFSDTVCAPLPSGTIGPLTLGTTPERVIEVYNQLSEHCQSTTLSTAIDAKHDTVFGTGFYCLSILQELLRIGASQSITARFALRTIVECFITLAYMVKRDKPDLWKSHRVFGAGQAKLQFLKLAELDGPTYYVNSEALEELANEDMWEEYLSIDLGHWSGADLRTLSLESKTKEDYDRYYGWTSSFAHGHWGSIRDSVYDTCANPLHRLHRIPRPTHRALPDVVPDVCMMVDKVLELVASCYPNFAHRVTISLSC